MSDNSNHTSPVRGWTTKQIANFVAASTGNDTPISLVWNWQKRTEDLEKGDLRRFPESIGHDEKGQAVYNPLEVVTWLRTNKEIDTGDGPSAEFWYLADQLRGRAISNKEMERILSFFIDEKVRPTTGHYKSHPDLVITSNDTQMQFEVKLQRSVKQLDRAARRHLLEEIQRFFLADRFNAEFHTPPRLASLAARLLDARPGSRVFDPCAGSGRLLAAVADQCSEPGLIELVGQEVNELTAHLGDAMIAVTEAAKGSRVLQGDSLTFNPAFVGFADYVITHYPLRTKIDPKRFRSSGSDPRFAYMKPTTAGDVAWVQILLSALKPTGGRAVAIGSLFTTSHRQSDKLRETLLRRRHVEAVIRLAKDQRAYGNGLPPTIIVLDTDPERAFRRKTVLFVDVALTKDETQAKSADDFVVALVKAFRAGSLEDKAEHPHVTWRAAHDQEIAAADYVLAPSHYIGQTTERVDPKQLEERLRSLSKQLAETRRQLEELQTKRKNLQ